MNIRIETNNTKFYIQLLSILNPILEISKRPNGKEVRLLGKMLYYYNSFIDKGETPDYAMKQIFSRDYRMKLMEEIGEISEASFNNKISRMRSRGIIENEGPNARITQKYLFKKTDDVTFIFEWKQ